MLLAFHYGNFDNHYGDGTRVNAAKNGRIYADTTVAELSTDFGSFTMSGTSGGQSSYSWTPVASGRADVLVVAGGGGGGGGGGGSSGGGGGGAAGFNSISLPVLGSFSIAIGQGGTGGIANDPNGQPGMNGINSYFGEITANGGGGGGAGSSTIPEYTMNGLNGGSGGGAGSQRGGGSGSLIGSGGAGIVGQGLSGGQGFTGNTPFSLRAGGGGGGAGSTGVNGASNNGGNGGQGKASIIDRNVYAGGGGGGNSVRGGDGGEGGGGQGGTSSGTSAQKHTGGGGGGGCSFGTGGSGGSGIVIIRFLYDARPPATIPNLAAWYTANSAELQNGSVTFWRDLSGRGNHVEAAAITGSIKRADPNDSSSAVQAGVTRDEIIIAFHYGDFDYHYGDVNVTNATKNGRIYANSTAADFPADFGSLVVSGTSGGQTTYSWTPGVNGVADVLVVAGGGGGGGTGNGNLGQGGGGAGGFVYGRDVNLSNSSYTIKIGTGGGGGQPVLPGNKGFDSAFSTLLAYGGGYGGRTGTPGGDGGSGGGAGGRASTTGSQGGIGVSTQGFNGGDRVVTYGTAAGGGGGGGSGQPNTTTSAGNGGLGTGFSISGVNKFYCGGGGGGYGDYVPSGSPGSVIGGLGGLGGGGNGGSSILAQNGTPHTGGGGGGGGHIGEFVGGNGGSGIVIIRFRITTGRGPTAFPFLYGSPTDGLRFPTSVMDTTSNYTLFHVARYYKPTGPPARLRIFDGVTSNWLSGFVSGQAGVAYHGTYLTATTDLHGNQWVLSTDQNNLYRSNGTDRTLVGYTNGTSRQLSINNGSSTSQRSDWAVAEVLVYDRQLTLSEYLSIEAYLAAKYFGLATIPETGLISGALINAVFYSGAQGGGAGNAGGRGYPVSIGRLGTRVGKSLGSVLRALDYRGRGVGALDNIGLSTLPVAAYSLRRLFGEYAGPQVRVRRSTDNMEADIYMDSIGTIVSISGSVLTSLSSWLNGAIAYVTTWYDQSRNSMDVSNPDLATQPLLVYNAFNTSTFTIEFVKTLVSNGSFLYNSNVSTINKVTLTLEQGFNAFMLSTQRQVSVPHVQWSISSSNTTSQEFALRYYEGRGSCSDSTHGNVINRPHRDDPYVGCIYHGDASSYINQVEVKGRPNNTNKLEVLMNGLLQGSSTLSYTFTGLSESIDRFNIGTYWRGTPIWQMSGYFWEALFFPAISTSYPVLTSQQSFLNFTPKTDY